MLLEKIPHVVADTFGDTDSQNIADFCTRFSFLLVAEKEISDRLSFYDNKPLCCGWEYPNEKGAIYIHHSGSADCPTHGVGRAGRGARVYVGVKHEKILDAHDMRVDYVTSQKIRAELADVRRSLQIVRASLSRLAADYRQHEFDLATK